MCPSGGSGGGTMATPPVRRRSSSSKPPVATLVVLAFAAVAGIGFFSQRVDQLDAWGLIGSGALFGVVCAWMILSFRR